MKINRTTLLAALLPLLCGCASFNSGDILVERSTARAMLADTSITPFAEIEVSWLAYPYRSPTDSIGEGSASRPAQRIKPLPPLPEELSSLTRRAREVFANAGLYDKAKGKGVLRLELTTLNRWTYADLWNSYLVDTGFIFILPSSLRSKYLLTADFTAGGKEARVETAGAQKTTFHLLMAPLYPFFPPGRREDSLLKQMLWRSATDVYAALKQRGGVPGELPPPAQLKDETPGRLSGPPVTPDRTWLPDDGKAASPDGAAIKPETPDKTWVVPSKEGAAVPEKEIKPEPADKTWSAPVPAAEQPRSAEPAQEKPAVNAAPASSSSQQDD